MPVIVTGGQFPAALAALRSLHREGFGPLAVATSRASYARFSRTAARVVRAPDATVSASRFVEVVARLCGDVEQTVIIPGTEPELVALVKWFHLLPPSVLGLPTSEVLTRVTDKVLLNEIALSAGLAVLPTLVLRSPETIHERSIDFPVIAKPIQTVAQLGDKLTSRSGVVVATAAQLQRYVAALTDHDVILQPVLKGQLYSLAGVMWDGKLHTPVQQVAFSIFPVPCGGSAIARTVPVDMRMVETLERILTTFGWEGIARLQWIRQGSRNQIIDLNPRIYGSLALANASGAELANVWVKHLLGRPAGEPVPHRDVLYRNLETFARTRVRVQLPPSQTPADGVANSVLTWTDPMPVLASGVRGLRKLRRAVKHTEQPAFEQGGSACQERREAERLASNPPRE